MSTRPQPVDLRIVSVWSDTDLRGRPITKYVIEDRGGFLEVFQTPQTSRLSEFLFKQVRRNRLR